MDIKIDNLMICPGGNHITVFVDINGIKFRLNMQKSDFYMPDNPEEGKEALAVLMRNYVMENNITIGNIKASLIGRTFKL